MINKVLQEKINRITKKNGIKSFGMSDEDVRFFSVDELKELSNRGLIYDKYCKKEIMKIEFKNIKGV